MTSKFSIDNRELLQRISSGDAVVGIDFGNLIVRELAAFRLAAMASEPDCKERKLFCSTDTARMRKVISVSAGTDVVQTYRHAQPAMVVPEEIKHRIGGLDWGWEGEFNRGWNACRAAMLATAPHDTHALNSVQSVDSVADRWIPVSERMPEIGDIVLTAMGGVVNVGEMECSAANCRFFTSVIFGRELPATHWMPMPTAPQEVK